MDDWQLLRDYVDHGSEAAFESLVKRHVDMVYAASLRQVRDAHLAQDVTQAAFLILARKAAGLKPSVVLPGWLYRTASHVASRAIRDRIRQQRREQEAAAMNVGESDEAMWAKLAPQLDGALNSLGAADRDAVVLRYLKQYSFRELAQTLGVSEDAAKKRVSRALEKLRSQLTRSGIGASAVALGAILTTHTAEAAPASTIAAATAAGVGAGIASADALAFADGLARDWFLTRLKWSAVGIAFSCVLLFCLVAPIWHQSARTGDPVQRQVITPNVPIAIQSEQTRALKEEATPQPNPRTMRISVVARENGEPLPEATASVVFYRGDDDHDRVEVHADPQGILEITRPDRALRSLAVVIGAPKRVPMGYGWQLMEEPSLPSHYTVKLQRGTRVAGTVVDEQGKPVAGVAVKFSGEGIQANSRGYVTYQHPTAQVVTDNHGVWTTDVLAISGSRKTRGSLSHPDYTLTGFAFDMKEPAEPVTLVIQRGVPFFGVVLNPERERVADARVEASPSDVDFEAANLDGTGGFSFHLRTHGRANLKVTAKGYRTFQKWVELQDPGLNAEITLERAVKAGNQLLQGRVVDQDGQPIWHVRINLASGSTLASKAEWSAQTEDDGRFAWTEAPDGTVSLDLFSSYHEPMPRVKFATDGVEHTIAMEALPWYRLRCTVTDKSTGQAVPFFTVSVNETRRVSQNEWAKMETFLGEGIDGLFECRRKQEDLTPLGSAIPPNALRIEAEGYIVETVSLPRKLDHDIELSAALQPSTEATGWVYRPDGRPAANAEINYHAQSWRIGMLTPGRFCFGRTSSSPSTDHTRADGSFALQPPEEGGRLLIAHPEGWAVVPLPCKPSAQIILNPWGRVEGTLRIGQNPGAGQTITLQSENFELADWRPGTPADNEVRYRMSVQTDAQGAFAFDRVPAGRARISRTLASAFSGGSAVAESYVRPVEVKFAQTVAIQLGGAGVSVRGRLTVNSQRSDLVLQSTPQKLVPAAGLVGTGGVPSYGFFCREDGTFFIEDVPPGAYLLEAAVDAEIPLRTSAMVGPSIRVNAGRGIFQVTIPETAVGEYYVGELVVPVSTNPPPRGLRFP